MRLRAIAALGALFVPVYLTGQGLPVVAKAATSTSKNETPPHTADGQPDLEGVWTNSTLTPLERPPEFAGKEFLTEQETADYV